MLNIKKVQSPFTFLGSTIRNLKIENHLIYLGENTKEEYKLEILPSEVQHEKKDKIFFGAVAIKVEIKLSTENDPESDTINLTIEGGFAAPENIGEEHFEKLLSLNGAATLYSIARAKIEAISNATFEKGKITLPVINIHQYYEEEKKALDAESKQEEKNEQE